MPKKSPHTEHATGVLLEHIDSKLDLLIEGHSALDKKIDKKIDEVNEKVDRGFAEIDYKFNVVMEELHIIRNELKEKVGRDEFILLEKRVTHLEKTRK